jgi:hypothetical protein
MTSTRDIRRVAAERFGWARLPRAVPARRLRRALDGPCGNCDSGNCDSCDAGTARDREPGAGEFAPESSVHHVEWGHGVVISVERDRMTVLFDQQGYRTPSLDAVRENNPVTACAD